MTIVVLTASEKIITIYHEQALNINFNLMKTKIIVLIIGRGGNNRRGTRDTEYEVVNFVYC